MSKKVVSEVKKVFFFRYHENYAKILTKKWSQYLESNSGNRVPSNLINITGQNLCVFLGFLCGFFGILFWDFFAVFLGFCFVIFWGFFRLFFGFFWGFFVLFFKGFLIFFGIFYGILIYFTDECLKLHFKLYFKFFSFFFIVINITKMNSVCRKLWLMVKTFRHKIHFREMATKLASDFNQFCFCRFFTRKRKLR